MSVTSKQRLAIAFALVVLLAAGGCGRSSAAGSGGVTESTASTVTSSNTGTTGGNTATTGGNTGTTGGGGGTTGGGTTTTTPKTGRENSEP